jgi:hypothetical protein
VVEIATVLPRPLASEGAVSGAQSSPNSTAAASELLGTMGHLDADEERLHGLDHA